MKVQPTKTTFKRTKEEDEDGEVYNYVEARLNTVDLEFDKVSVRILKDVEDDEYHISLLGCYSPYEAGDIPEDEVTKYVLFDTYQLLELRDMIDRILEE